MSRELVVLKEELWNGEGKSWVGVGGVGGAKVTLTTPIHTLSLHFGARVPGRAEDSMGQRETECHGSQEKH